MISRDDALKIADESFPFGPETLAKHLRAEIRHAVLIGCDGWCLSCEDRVIVRINTSRSLVSQRFTLAHELGHLILGIPPLVGESMTETLASNSKEERRVNNLAAELLLPQRVVEEHITTVPVVEHAISKLAKEANISRLAAVLRIANLAPNIGLENAAVAHFVKGNLKWIWSSTLFVPASALPSLLVAASEAHPAPLRQQQSDGRIVVASILDNPKFQLTNMLIQLLPAGRALPTTPYERRLQLEKILLGPSCTFRNKLQGILGSLKNGNWSNAPEAERDFWKRHTDTFKATALNSDVGREYIRLRIDDWF